MSRMLAAKQFLVIGLIILLFEVTSLALLFAADSRTALKILSMISACHIGGRLAFIGAGFELGFTALPLMLIIVVHNSAYVILTYSIFLLLSERINKLKFIQNIHEKVQENRKLRSKWNIFSIAFFVWIPLPMTGAVVGALIAFFEGFDERRTMSIVLPSMWFGVVSWTLAFDQLYHLLHAFNPKLTLGLTFLLLLLPLLYNFIKWTRKREAM